MGVRKELETLEETMKGINFTNIKRMDDTTFTALVVALIDIHTRVSDLAQIKGDFVEELESDYVDDFLISIREYMTCRENYAKRILKERLEGINNGRG